MFKKFNDSEIFERYENLNSMLNFKIIFTIYFIFCLISITPYVATLYYWNLLKIDVAISGVFPIMIVFLSLTCIDILYLCYLLLIQKVNSFKEEKFNHSFCVIQTFISFLLLISGFMFLFFSSTYISKIQNAWTHSESSCIQARKFLESHFKCSGYTNKRNSSLPGCKSLLQEKYNNVSYIYSPLFFFSFIIQIGFHIFFIKYDWISKSEFQTINNDETLKTPLSYLSME